MDKIEQILNIPLVGKDTNFWMIRAKRGFFFDEFIRNEYIAIGWNSIVKSMIDQKLTSDQANQIKESIKETYNDNRPGMAFNKCIRFCSEIKVGDIAVIVDNSRVAFAYIGEYYEDMSSEFTVELEKDIHRRIEKANPNIDTFDCPYIKRRKISLIKMLSTDDTISPYLQSAIARNWHSLSDLNEYAELILSGCFDAFIFKEKLTVTFRVKRKEDINVLDLANFVLPAARLLSDDEPETVSVKTTLHSPGDILLQISNFTQENLSSVLVCWWAIFGAKIQGCEFNSVLGVIKNIINYKYNKEKKKLELRLLAAEANKVEQEVLAKKLDNIEKMQKLQLATAEECATKLAEAAQNLEVQPSMQIDGNVIDLIKFQEIQSQDQKTNTSINI